MSSALEKNDRAIGELVVDLDDVDGPVLDGNADLAATLSSFLSRH